MQDHILALAVALVRKVGARMRDVLEGDENLALSHKGISDLVTEVDIWSDQLFAEEISRRFPDHLFIGEESSRELAQRSGKTLPELVSRGMCWIVDPLDGTTNFANGIPFSCVSVAVLSEGQRIAGVVYDPYRDELFTALAGRGATLGDRRLSASSKTRLIECVAVTGFSNDRWRNPEEHAATVQGLVMSCRNVRAFGAAALHLAWVALGRVDAVFEYRLKPWDVAAGSLLVEEAGAVMKSYPAAAEFSLFGSAFLAAGKDVARELDSLVLRHNPQFV